MTTGTGTKQVFLKELREMARDRRVLQASLIMPIFVIALFVFVMGVVQRAVTEKPEVRIAIVGVTFIDLKEQFPDLNTSNIDLVPTFAEGTALVEEKAAQLVIETTLRTDDDGITITVHRVGYIDSDPLASLALAELKSQVNARNLENIKTVLQENNLPAGLTEAEQVQPENLGKDEGLAGSSIVSLLPYLIVLWAFYGGMSVVADLVAGEKERGTMETLMVSPVRRAAVALGKILALMVVCFIGSLTTLAGVFIAGSIKSPLTENLFPTGLSLGLDAILFSIITLVTLVAFFASMMVSICAYARNIREAQTYLGLLSFIIIMPAIFSQIIGFTGLERATWVLWTPVLNTALAIKDLILGSATISQLGPVWIVNLVLASYFLWSSIKQFRKEEIVLRV
jgi:sodium transport system permease protein